MANKNMQSFLFDDEPTTEKEYDLPQRFAGEYINRFYVGIDNGVSGSIAIIKPSGEVFFDVVPTKSEQSYTKKVANITRIDGPKLTELLLFNIPEDSQVHVKIERPMVNPKMFKTTLSAMRCLEATLTVVEMLGYPLSYIDSREWQKALLPKGVRGEELKTASLSIGNRMFPQFKTLKHKDRDGLLIAEYSRRMRF